MNRSGRSVVRSSRLVWDQEVAGSNPAAPTRGMSNHPPFFIHLTRFYLQHKIWSRSSVRRGGSNRQKQKLRKKYWSASSVRRGGSNSQKQKLRKKYWSRSSVRRGGSNCKKQKLRKKYWSASSAG